MANAIEHKKFSLTELGSNKNKFWNVTLFDNDDVHSQWGRQGDGNKSGQQKTWSSVGKSFMLKKIREKEKKGYRENKTIESSGSISASSISNNNLKDIASKQIKASCKLVQDLVDYLVKVNAHQILTAVNGITYDTSTAQFKTTQGIVVPEQVDRARKLLSNLSDLVVVQDYDNYDFEDSLNEYLSLIPRNFGRRRMEPKDILPDLTAVQKENDVLDGLDASFAGAIKTPNKKKNEETPEIFNVEMELIEDKKIISKINSYYEKTKKTMHQSYRYKLKRIYKVYINTVVKSFENYGKPLGNIKELFHGTKCSNCLSILKQGLVIPPASSSYCTGRLYGNGVYASDISSKALNYATNYWNRSGNSDRIFMFIVDFAMGKVYSPTGKYGVNYPPKGYDSTFAKSGKSGVYNNEMIVYKTSQVNLKYLLEFE